MRGGRRDTFLSLTFLIRFPVCRTINNVEEHIRNAFLSEMASKSSSFRNIRVDPDTIEIKRLLDQEVLSSAFFSSDSVSPKSRHMKFH